MNFNKIAKGKDLYLKNKINFSNLNNFKCFSYKNFFQCINQAN